jgi:hypothetical protein
MLVSYKVLSGDVVSNIVMIDDSDPSSLAYAASVGATPAAGVGIGWVRDGETFVPPPIEQPAIVFPTLSRRQLRLGLLSIGVAADDVEAEIATIADAQERAAALIDWQDASAYERTHPLIAQVADALGLPESQVDALWLWAAGI